MVYSNKFVMCILVNGQIAKEFPNGTTLIPFGSEYTIRFRNKNSRRAVVKFTIDDEDASSGGYIIPANDFIDIHRYAHKDVAFKFVDLNSPEAIEFGKNDNKDKNKGVIEAKFYLEKVYTPVYTANPSPALHWQNINMTTKRCKGPGGSGMHSTNYNVQGSVCSSSYTPSDLGFAGATVEGSVTGQSFTSQYINIESDYVAVKTCLQGYVEDSVVSLKNENESLKLEIMEKQNEKLKLEILKEENKKLKAELEKLKNS